jgi:hypothetical protein
MCLGEGIVPKFKKMIFFFAFRLELVIFFTSVSELMEIRGSIVKGKATTLEVTYDV